jgi:glycosyltransferase involved in cell wall biosynthesis
MQRKVASVRRMPRVSVIVPARDAAATIGRTLAALADQDLSEPYEVLVVDDGSRDTTVAEAERAAGPVSVLRQHGLGPGAARNRGAEAARGEILAFTDADCFPARGWLSAGVGALEGRQLIQGLVRPDPEASRGPFDRTLWVERETGLYETANLFVEREVFERLRGFEAWLDPVVGKELAEDVWFGWRARRAGVRTAFCPEAVVHHAVFPRGPRAFVAERRRLQHFPEMVARMPELRDAFLYRRWFLTARSATFVGACLGAAAAATSRSPLPLVAAAPYARALARRSKQWRRRAPEVAAVTLAADAVGLAHLVKGSVRARTAVL